MAAVPGKDMSPPTAEATKDTDPTMAAAKGEESGKEESSQDRAAKDKADGMPDAKKTAERGKTTSDKDTPEARKDEKKSGSRSGGNQAPAPPRRGSSLFGTTWPLRRPVRKPPPC